MEWQWTALLVIGCGALGGLANAIMAGGERYLICLPGKVGKDFELGVMGPIVIGVVASLVAYGSALHETSPAAQVVGCLLAGAGGSNYLTSRIRIGNYRDATAELASGVADEAQALAAEVLAGADEMIDEASAMDREEEAS